MAQLFPDVLNATLVGHSSEGITAFVVPAQYAFAVVQVKILSGVVEDFGGIRVMRVDTSHGTYRSCAPIRSTEPLLPVKDFPVLNLIIPGGQSFQLFPLGGGSNTRVIITALCHRRPA